MIVGLEGKVVYKNPAFIHIQLNNGLTYKVNVSLQSVSNINNNENISLHITQIIREDANLLFGFLDLNEQKIFETLVKLNGIGPSTAMGICSTLKPDEFQKAILESDPEVFKKVPGIGPKGAKRIIVELGDFNLNVSDAQNFQKDAIMALESLGFKKDKITKVLINCESTEIQSLIKEALKKLT